jgi:SRSO17 transposase
MASMDAATQRRLVRFVRPFLKTFGREERRRHGEVYVRGLMLGAGRRTAAGIARASDDDEQAIQQFVNQSRWRPEALLEGIAQEAQRLAPGRRAFVVDDTGFAKQGRHSVGVARQYSGTLGKVGNCQVAASLSLAWEQASIPLEFALYLPQEWTSDPKRLRMAGLDPETPFKEKWRLALDLIDRALSRGLEKGVVCADAAYGSVTEFRRELAARGLEYALGVQETISVWAAPRADLPAGAYSGRGRRPKSKPGARRSALELALSLPGEAWHTVRWAEGTKGPLSSRFACVRVEPGHAARIAGEREAEQWLLAEWPEDSPKPAKYWLACLSSDSDLLELVTWAKMRWGIEQNYRELKEELGLDHFEGRSMRGWLCHVTLTLVAFLFLAKERLRRKSELVLEPP